MLPPSGNFYWLIGVRCMVGFGVGGLGVCFSMLMEILPAPMRGKAGYVPSIFLLSSSSFCFLYFLFFSFPILHTFIPHNRHVHLYNVTLQSNVCH